MVPRVLSGVASEASGGGSCGGTALGESTDCERGAEPALAERSGLPSPRRRNLARLRHTSPARRALSRCGLLGLNKGEQRGRRPRYGRVVSEAGRRPRALGRGRHGGEGAGKREEPRRAGDGRAGGRAALLATRFEPLAHAAVCFVDGAFPDSPGEPSPAPDSLRRDVPPDLQSFLCWRRETSWYTHSVCWQSSNFRNRSLHCTKILR